MTKTYWDQIYESTPLTDIPWHRTQSDWFRELLDSKKLQGKTALDLGCGTGMKSIQLAEAGYARVLGIDISAQAIEYAKQNASKLQNIEFKIADATNLSFLESETFDLVLDWANLHCIDKTLHSQYIKQLLEHTHRDSIFVLRVFAKPEASDQNSFIAKSGDAETEITLFTEEIIDDLFSSHFKISQTNESRPRTQTQFSFLEYLMIRK